MRASASPVGLRLAPLLVAALVLGCSSDAPRREGCTPRKGMTAGDLVRCGCILANSGGSSVVVEGGPGGGRAAIKTAQYICVYGNGRVDRVEVVNGVAQRVL
jgi:hypothetical protein